VSHKTAGRFYPAQTLDAALGYPTCEHVLQEVLKLNSCLTRELKVLDEIFLRYVMGAEDSESGC
jgi:hypothetical protein